MPRTSSPPNPRQRERERQRAENNEKIWNSLDTGQKTRALASFASKGVEGPAGFLGRRLLGEENALFNPFTRSVTSKTSKRKGGKDTDELDVTAKKGGGHVKKYTGGKSGDKYYGGGPVYPRPTKGS